MRSCLNLEWFSTLEIDSEGVMYEFHYNVNFPKMLANGADHVIIPVHVPEAEVEVGGYGIVQPLF